MFVWSKTLSSPKSIKCSSSFQNLSKFCAKTEAWMFSLSSSMCSEKRWPRPLTFYYSLYITVLSFSKKFSNIDAHVTVQMLLFGLSLKFNILTASLLIFLFCNILVIILDLNISVFHIFSDSNFQSTSAIYSLISDPCHW